MLGGLTVLAGFLWVLDTWPGVVFKVAIYCGLVKDLGHQDHGRQRIDPAETPKPADRRAIRGALRHRRHLLIKRRRSCERLLEGEQRGLEVRSTTGRSKRWRRIHVQCHWP